MSFKQECTEYFKLAEVDGSTEPKILYSGKESEGLKMLLWNVRSMNRKVDFIMQYIVDRDIDIACITESWLTDESNSVTFKIKNYGYNISHKHRNNTSGGGVCLIFKPIVNVKIFNCKLIHPNIISLI